MKITLISWTPDPLKVIASQQKNMRGQMVHDISEINSEESEELFVDVMKTRLRGALEFVDFVFQVEGVTRAFTHQLVRHRVGVSFSQESMRFTSKDFFKYLVPSNISSEGEALKIYTSCMQHIQDSYNDLLELGISIEDARGVLPTNIFTKIGFKCNYRTLYELCEIRLCHQSQKEFRNAAKMMKREVSNKVSPLLGKYLQPSCVHSGFCEFGSLWDRKCILHKKYPIRDLKIGM